MNHPLSDFVLFAKIKEGDIRAFETLFKRYYEPLCLFGHKMTHEMDTAEEIVQQLFYTLWKERASVHIVLSVKSYLYKSVRNQVLHHVEHMRVRERYQTMMSGNMQENALHDTPQDILEYKELEQQFELALEAMPQRRRDIFRMNRFEGKKYEQIAQELSLSVKTIEAEMSKALQALRKTMRHQ